MKTFTKKAVTFSLILGALGGMTPFILSFFGKESVDALGIAWVTEVFAVVIVYCCKSYFETKAEKKQELEEWEVKHDVYSGNSDNGSGGSDSEVFDTVDQESD